MGAPATLSVIVALQAVSVPGSSTADGSSRTLPPLALTRSLITRCDDAAPSGDVIVCAQRQDRYRLPLPVERTPLSDHVRDEPSSGMAALTPPGRCGIFAGERRCSKRDVVAYGYGAGRDPVTVLTRLARKVADPDAD